MASGISVACKDICFVTSRKDGESGEIKTHYILKHVSLPVKPGRLMAIMGPSGSGKTSLLNILSGRTRNPLQPIENLGLSSKVDIDTAKQGCLQKRRMHKAPIPYGSIYMNGQLVDGPAVIKKNSQYVMQSDCLLPFLSVEETLHFSATLKLAHLPSAERAKTVDTVIHELGLNSCRNVVIGDSLRKGVSGGQRKRVAIGIEILDSPELLYLDEPTSGLDSSLAFDVVKILRHQARKGRTIIATIHQPRAQIFSMFDDLMLLAEGRPLYCGPANEALKYFASVGLTPPPRCDVADFCVDLAREPKEQVTTKGSRNPLSRMLNSRESFHSMVSRSFVGAATLGLDAGTVEMIDPKAGNMSRLPEEDVADQSEEHTEPVITKKGSRVDISADRLEQLPDEFAHSVWGLRLQEDVETLMHDDRGLRLKEIRKAHPLYRFGRNFVTLTHRATINKIRDPTAIIIGVVVTALLCLIMGMVYLQVSKPEHEVNCVKYFNFVGVLAFSGIQNSFSAMHPELSFPERRPQFNRETASGLYSPLAFHLGKLVGELPFIFICPIVHWLIFYWLVGIGSDASLVFFYLLMALLTAYAATGWFGIVAMMSKTTTIASTLAPLGVILSILLSGLWITEDALPAFWRWLKYLSWVRYSVNSILLKKFQDTNPAVIDTCAPLDSFTPWGNLGMLVVIGTAGRIIAFLPLCFTNRRVGMEA